MATPERPLNTATQAPALLIHRRTNAIDRHTKTMHTLVILLGLVVVSQGAPQFPGGQGFPQQFASQGAPQQYSPQGAQQQFAPQFQAQQQPQFAGAQQHDAQPQGQQQRQQPSNIIPANVYNGFGKDGSLNFAFQTLDGQQRMESLGSDGSVRGSYSYLGADGKQVEIKYTADKNGFHASGPTVPKAPPALALAAAQSPSQQPAGDGGSFGGQYGAAGGAPDHFGGGAPVYGGAGHGFGGAGHGFGGPAFAGSQGVPSFGGGQEGHSFQGFQGAQGAFPGQQGAQSQFGQQQQYAPFQG